MTPSVKQIEIYICNEPPSTIKVDLHFRWLTTENFKNHETVKGKFKTQKNATLRWLATYMNFNLLHTGCPIAYAQGPKNLMILMKLSVLAQILSFWFLRVLFDRQAPKSSSS